ncbi:hypothetical protein [Candidatus Xianfuyuplasma coldseepsis]|uniref:Uncharacterized protein n=1 Tax=Candidatus Xianfuyuplasma coldseepsis TaxID=2782163 RepID=A0A7L7KNM2_9MOLU|nr:hypothetical protein [Xianfuyuplasma coldseepsis]QMS84341.1 hypothetical protein G4Z02_00815 [Xianfuyuplasma coldseepsis]
MFIESEKTIIKSIEKYVEPYHSISIIGMAKNAGKTTVLNTIISAHKTKRLAISSVGLDGEEIDTITNQNKPRIQVYPGMIIATTKECLDQSTITYVIHENTNIRTALGTVVICEVIRAGLILVAGPSSRNKMKKLKSIITKYEPYKILFDGALFRKSIASRELVDGIIFVTGASYSSNIDKVINDTKITIDHYSIKAVEQSLKINVKTNENNIIIFENKAIKTVTKDNIIDKEHILEQFLTEETRVLYLPRSLNEKIVEVILSNKNKLTQFKIIVQDATYILLKPQTLAKLSKIGIKISVLNPIDIIFVAYNPISPYGYSFDNNEFKSKLRAAIGFEPINVLQDLE